MTRKDWGLVGLICAGIVGFVAVATVMGDQQRRRMTAEAPGVVTATRFDSGDEASDSGSTRVSYSFTPAGGAPRRSSTNWTGDVEAKYPVGRPVKVCYNPDKPKESSIAPEEAVCGG